MPGMHRTTSPRIMDFTERILVQLKPLTEGNEEIQNHVKEENEGGVQDERTQAIKLLKTGASPETIAVTPEFVMVKAKDQTNPCFDFVLSAEVADRKCRALFLQPH